MLHSTPTMPKSWLWLFLLIAAVWGSSFLFMRVAAAEFGIFPTAFLRMAIGAAFMLPLLIWRRLLSQVKAGWRLILVIGLFNSALPFTCYAFAVLHITTGLSAILNATGPMFAALAAWLWLNDKLRAWRVAGIVIGFMGIVLLVGEQAAIKGDDFWLSAAAMAACLLAALCYGITGNAIKQHMSHLHPWTIAGGTMLGAALWLLVPALLSWPSAPPSHQAWTAVIVVGVLCSAIAFMLYFELLRRTDVIKTMSVTYLIPVFALLYGALFLDEHITPWMVGCGLVVLVGTALATGLVTAKSTPRPAASAV